MIDSGIYSRSSLKISVPSEEEIKMEENIIQNEKSTVGSSAMFHIINSYLFSIFSNKAFGDLQKEKMCLEFGENLGEALAQEQCLGYVKFVVGKSEKNENKQFVGEMKLLNSKVWNSVVGSKAKLFALTTDVAIINSYRIEDREFILGKSIEGSGDKQLKKLLFEFCKGLVKGCIAKFQIQGEISCGEVQEGIYIELKNLSRKGQNASLEKMKSNIF